MTAVPASTVAVVAATAPGMSHTAPAAPVTAAARAMPCAAAEAIAPPITTVLAALARFAARTWLAVRVSSADTPRSRPTVLKTRLVSDTGHLPGQVECLRMSSRALSTCEQHSSNWSTVSRSCSDGGMCSSAAMSTA
ncbi:hypothetical protein GA0074692_6792 [Micromonospora pallida]|uniref:Secreted protein n=1 Tax=Micromonospora pallida TaxID=145854 RepID=A0A1C6TND0_9ACTN|nr:hypothetical protein GA0074692_6792 [Micromonospora pallida]